jgi:hypothetical protein
MNRRLADLSNRSVMLILIGIAVASSALSFLVNVINQVDTAPGWWVSWLQNFSTEMFGAALTFILLTLIVGNRQEKQRLIRQLGSRVNEEAVRAAEELRAQGWLQDGSLQGLNLERANLKRADLNGANLQGANLHRADLQQANLSRVNLEAANLQQANLEETILREANLLGANLQQANLLGAFLGKANLCSANLQGVTLDRVYFDANTILPDGNKWTSNTNIYHLTASLKPNFWQPTADKNGKLPSWYKPQTPTP